MDILRVENVNLNMSESGFCPSAYAGKLVCDDVYNIYYFFKDRKSYEYLGVSQQLVVENPPGSAAKEVVEEDNQAAKEFLEFDFEIRPKVEVKTIVTLAEVMGAQDIISLKQAGLI